MENEFAFPLNGECCGVNFGTSLLCKSEISPKDTVSSQLCCESLYFIYINLSLRCLIKIQNKTS